MRISLAFIATLFIASSASAQALQCNVAGFTPSSGIAASLATDTLTLTWDGDQGQEVRMRLGVVAGTPTIRDIAVRAKGGVWKIAGANMTPDYRVVAGFRRVTEQQLQPLRQLKIDITPALVESIKWDAFWDAPLNTEKLEDTRMNAIPPPDGVAGQPGLPRKPEEISRATASYDVKACEVTSKGARVVVSFPGVNLGVFAGRLEYTIYKGSNLIVQTVVAKTEMPSVAYKYEAGLKGLAIQPASRMVWRDMANNWQEYRFGGAPNSGPVTLKASNRLVIAEGAEGSIAAFPPPHNFFWSRETAFNLGYVWYRKDGASSFSFGVREPDHEANPHETGRGEEDTTQNFALRSARPGTMQRMPVYLYVSAGAGEMAARGALAFTRDDRFKQVPGYQVMATHFHSALVGRLRAMGGDLDVRLPDLDVVKAAGINIFAPIDGGGLGFGNAAGDRLANMADYYEVARRHSDKNFLIMPNEEGGAAGLGGHNDLLISHPLFWVQSRPAGKPLVEQHPKYGKVYNIGSQADMMEMVRQENLLIYMPHPRSKGSTGYPDAIKDKPWFLDERYRGIGVRWGMGLDGSEARLCEYRCQTLWDEMNNWVADLPTPLKYIQAITETYQQGPGDDVYANSPVNYVKLDALPAPGDWSPIIDAMKRGDYFWSSGEVLVPSYSVQGAGAKRTIVAEVEWTFPLEFVEVVWGDGTKTDRQIIQTTDAGAFGKKRFEIPFDATGKKWVRFAAWDAAGNGAMVQPIKLTTGTTTTTR
jgi:hypothetical protein